MDRVYSLTDDKRYLILSRILSREGITTEFITPGEVKDLPDLPVILLAHPGMDRETQRKVLLSAPRGSRLCAGRLWNENAAVASERGIDCFCFDQDESYLSQNALLTAEGCLETVLRETPFALSDCPVLVTGFGRVGRECARLFRRCGARVAVLARRGKSYEAALNEGFEVVDCEKIPVKRRERVLVNTVEKKGFVNEKVWSFCVDLALIVDLASGKDNVDPGIPDGVRFAGAPGLPGKCAPESAALILYRFLKRREII